MQLRPEGPLTMNALMTLGGAAVAACLGIHSAAAATIVLQDNFDASTQMLNWPGDGIFESIPQPVANGSPSVDLIGVGGSWDFFAGQYGNYVDMDGSTGYGINPAGQLDSVNKSIPAGSYVLTFLMGGNQRNAPGKTTVISLGDWSTTVGPLSGVPTSTLTYYIFSFITTGGTLSFLEIGNSDQQGNILDDVTLSAVPIPAALPLFAGGLGLMGWMARRRRKTA